MKNKFLSSFLVLFCSTGLTCLSADNFAGLYGSQAVMSPAHTSLSFGNAGQMPQVPQNQYNPNNSVYLAQPQQQQMVQVNPSNPYAMAQPNIMPQQMPSMPTYTAPPSQGYYPQSMPLDNMTGYGVNSYTAYKPMYGTPEERTQRNSGASALPYRNQGGIVLNPNSMIGFNPAGNAPDQFNPTVQNILNRNAGGGQQTAQENWFKRVFQRTNNMQKNNSFAW